MNCLTLIDPIYWLQPSSCVCVLLHKDLRLTEVLSFLYRLYHQYQTNVLGTLQRQNRVRVKRGSGIAETEKRKRNCGKKRVKSGKAEKRGGKAEKRVKGGKAEKRLKGGKAEKRVKGGKKCKTRIKCHFKLYY